MLTDFTTV